MLKDTAQCLGRDENSQPFSIGKVCLLNHNWSLTDFYITHETLEFIKYKDEFYITHETLEFIKYKEKAVSAYYVVNNTKYSTYNVQTKFQPR